MTSPLSPEAVAQMVAWLRGSARRIMEGTFADAADMLTALAAENATLRAEMQEAALQYLSDAGQAMDRIAALTEALAFYAGKEVAGIKFTPGDDAGIRARAALTTDKEPKT